MRDVNLPRLSRDDIGVLLCSCGGDISKVVDLAAVADFIKNWGKCKSVEICDSLCKDDGLSLVRRTIKRDGLSCLIIGGCSPKVNEKLFQEEMEKAGLNPLLLETVNLREQCAWVHTDVPLLATEKAKILVMGSVEKARFFDVKSLGPKSMRLGQAVTRRDLFRSFFKFFKEYRPVAEIDGRSCVGGKGKCNHCINSCPFHAIYDGDMPAVKEDTCRACGMCSAVCPTGAIQMSSYTDEQIVAQLRGIMTSHESKLEPKIVVFSCDEQGYLAADGVGPKGLSYSPNVLIVRVPCIALISEVHILKAFEFGAGGVLLSGCSPAGCPHVNGNEVAEKTCGFIRRLFSAFGLPENIDVIKSNGEPKAFVNSVEAFVKLISTNSLLVHKIKEDTPLGPTRRDTQINLIRSLSEKLEFTPSLRERNVPNFFAEVKIDVGKCSFCGVCVDRCPTKALKLLRGENAAKLNFTHARCINCGVCKNMCPEDAIELYRVLDFRQLIDQSECTLVEQKLISCIKCGKPFVPASTIELVSKIIGGGNKIADEQINFIKTCGECRTKALLAS